MQQRLLGREPLSRIPPQQAPDEILRLVAFVGPGWGQEIKVPPPDRVEDVVIGLAAERRVAA